MCQQISSPTTGIMRRTALLQHLSRRVKILSIALTVQEWWRKQKTLQGQNPMSANKS